MENRTNQFRFKSIKRSFEFESIYNNGRKVRLTNWLMVIFVDADNKQSGVIDSFYGVTASRKVGKAVLRNKLKRWVRNSAKTTLWPKKLYGKKSVFIFRPQGEGFYDKISFADFKSALENLR